MLAFGFDIESELLRTMSLLIVTTGRTVVAVPLLWPNTNVGAVAPLLVKASVLPEMKRSGAVPFAVATLVIFSLFRVKFPEMSLFEVVVTPAVWLALKSRVVSEALIGVALQPVPALHWVVPFVPLVYVKFAAFAFPPIAARARMDATQRRFLNREPWGRDGEDTTKF